MGRRRNRRRVHPHERRLRGSRRFDRRHRSGTGRDTMIAGPYWITTHLAIVRRPQGGELLDDEMLTLQEAGIDVVVSMLETEEARRAGLEREAFAAQAKGLKFVNFSVPDGGVPLDTTSFTEFLKDLENLLAHGKRVGVHCRASIGRSSVTSASLL